MGFDILKDKDPWMLAEEIREMDLFFSQIWLSHFANEFEKYTNKPFKKVLAIFKGYHLWFYFGDKDSFEVGENIVKKFLRNPEFAIKVNKEIISESDRLRKFAEKIPQYNLHKLGNKRLWEIYKTQDQIHTEYYEWGWIPVGVDMFHNNLTDTLKKKLREQGVKEGSLNECFVILTQPTKKSLIQQEQEEFLEIANTIQKNKNQKKLFKDLYKLFEEKEAMPFGLATHTPEYEERLEKKMDLIKDKINHKIYKKVQNYYNKYFYAINMWLWEDGAVSLDYYLKELVKFVGRDSDAEKLLKEKRKELKEGVDKRTRLIKKLKLSKDLKILFDAFGGFMVTKIYRRYAQLFAVYQMQPVIEEIAKRLDLSKKQVKFMLTKEVGDALTKGKINRKELKERTEFCAYLVGKNYEEIFTGEKARRLAKLVERDKLINVKELKGQTGCIGKAKGIVKIIHGLSDMPKMNKGDILVSIATNPDIVPAMKKAGAIITEQGGVTSHAAIVSRELNIPCVIGTKIATKVLKDGDLVEVDAIKGIVKILKK